MSTDPQLIGDQARLKPEAGDLNACLNAHGLYSPRKFVLRLSPEVHRRIASLPAGISTASLGFDDLRAYSTYLHETVHWWQHIGSVAGFISGMTFPVQSHANYSHLKNLLRMLGAKKSVRRIIETSPGQGGDFRTPVGLANVIVNNYYDISFFRSLISDPASVPAIVNDPFFDFEGHCYEIGYENTLALLARSVDRNFELLPDPRGWEDEFANLRAARKEGYYRGSRVTVAPIGTLQIFEGQARFAQLQFLHLAMRHNLGWDEIRSRGMLTERYVSAFNAFLQLTNLEWPPSVDHPTVGLFLLVCDTAINPGAGFPMPLRFFSAFIDDVNPGMRFLFLCRAIAKQRSRFSNAISDYSREEYIEVSSTLAHELIIDAPIEIAEKVRDWDDGSEGFRAMMSHHLNFDYPPENLPVTLLLSHFLAFNRDKFSRPEFFCWPGAWMAGDRVSSEVGALFDKHSALFIDKPDNDGIFPRVLEGRDEANTNKVFQTFYEFAVTYDMTSQWIVRPGPFVYDYSWLSSSATPEDCKRFAASGLERAYGVHPDSFELL